MLFFGYCFFLYEVENEEVQFIGHPLGRQWKTCCMLDRRVGVHFVYQDTRNRVQFIGRRQTSYLATPSPSSPVHSVLRHPRMMIYEVGKILSVQQCWWWDALFGGCLVGRMPFALKSVFSVRCYCRVLLPTVVVHPVCCAETLLHVNYVSRDARGCSLDVIYFSMDTRF